MSSSGEGGGGVRGGGGGADTHDRLVRTRTQVAKSMGRRGGSNRWVSILNARRTGVLLLQPGVFDMTQGRPDRPRAGPPTNRPPVIPVIPAPARWEHVTAVGDMPLRLVLQGSTGEAARLS